ncbi:ATP-binding protein [Allohahella sp. A8]|uniref:hybrid sensor histidine kinase/response regulator n=1 Tax=Allohahella sp. A8 TaxID=3141461 RepID=UPI003A80106F
MPISANNLTVEDLLRSPDLASSTLGSPDRWPKALLTVVKLMVDSQFPMFVAWGPNLAFLYNDQYSRIMGNKHPAAFGQPFSEVWWEIWSEISPIVDKALAGEATFHENMPLVIERNGFPEHAWFTFCYSPLRISDDEVGGMFCTVTETTVHVLSERRNAFQLKLSDSLASIADPAGVVTTAIRILGEEVNVSRVLFSEINEVERTFLIRQDWTQAGVSSIAGFYRQLDDFESDIIVELSHGRAVLVDDVAKDPRLRHQAATYSRAGIQAFIAIPLVKSGKLRIVLQLHQSQPYHWTEIDLQLAQDMAERSWSAVEHARAQAELRAERDQSRHIFDSMTEGFAIVDADWRILRINAAGLRISRTSSAQVADRNFWSIWPGLAQDSLEACHGGVMLHRQPVTCEQHFALGDEHPSIIELRMYPVPEGGVAIFFRDVTQRKRIIEKLKETDQRKDEFLAMLAHELRNPLAPISAAAELLQSRQIDASEIQQTSEVISRQVNHMTSLVDDLMDVSRVTRGLITLADDMLDVESIVSAAVEQVRPLVDARRHQIQVLVPPSQLWVQGDLKRLVQVLSNLLNNAAKYTPEGGNIEMSARAEDSEVVFVVSDNGIGMPPELIPSAFELFTQAKRSSDRSPGGLGIGLALVKRLVELHGGNVSAESPASGKGSEFTIRLPRVVPNGREASPAVDVSKAPNDSSTLKVLIVDDNVDAAVMLAMLLEAAGHSVSVEHSSEKALERAETERPDVCLLDIGLPDMDGNELARQLRKRSGTACSTLIAVTGYGQDKDREKTAAAGFAHHLVKPVNVPELMTLLSELSQQP